MKKYLALLCATMLCVCCLGLAACGGSSSSSAAASGSASASASSASESASASAASESASASAASASASAASASASAGSASASASAASAADNFVGSWKLAAITTEGITMSGDFSAMYDDDMEMALVVNADGTGTFSLGSDEASFTWTEKSPTAITLEVQAESDDSSIADMTTVEVTCEDGALLMAMESDDITGTVIFTADGTYAGAKEISAAAAKPITSEDALVGTWNLSGLNMLGINMYGEAEALAAMSGSEDMSVTFEKGGKATMSGSEMTYTVGADGASIEESGVTMPIMALGDDIIIDLSGVLGMDMVMLFSK